MKYTVRSMVWIAVYLLFVLLPLLALLVGSLPPARDFWTEFSAALGYSGLAIMGLQFGITARFRYVTEPWGEDVIYHFHRRISLFAVALVLVHPAIMFAVQPELRAIPDIGEIPLGAAASFISVGALVVLVVTALWRVRLRIPYEWWHLSHIALALTAVTGGLIHMVGWGFYLADPWKRALWIGLVLFWVALLFYVRLVKPLFMLRRPYRVSEVRHERGDTTTLVMRPDGHPGFRFTPGQFGWLTVWGSPFRITGHPFSFSSSAAVSDGRVEMSIRKLGDFTARISQVPVGQRVYLDGPYGAFTIGNPADMHVLIAGGVGVTPMMSMIRTLADQGDRRPVILLYGSRDFEQITFREELEALKARLDLTVVHVLSDPPEGWTGERGHITAELLKRHLPEPYAAHEYFICGPGVMMDAIEKTLAGLGVPMSKYHSERYSFV
ncbi:ferric reductase-like transmembrane domain-containing protein [Xanthobacter oligotrophicus]|uniref:ferredoxin reductase family protein n=1 Tax=Xanthobacter oligotrophicus TaxID=2607286 RepID=UPI0011F1F2DA|nr:ferric reductase-like transmembrane domain-containing protein [Xanthobacter oligotrophicus]MCG5233809.1 ferric reductase-like transmembrane domain-containing protein [Xanthobacter oligotrophicus]